MKHRYVFQFIVYGCNPGVGNPQFLIGSTNGVSEPLSDTEIGSWISDQIHEDTTSLSQKGFVSVVSVLVLFNQVT